MDPQQRLLLENGYAALHSARCDRQTLLEREIGVLVGIQANDFGSITLSKPTATLPVYAVSGFTFSVAAGRLSFVLGMQGLCFGLRMFPATWF
jgi:acyl transferase domain-containing protein